MYSLRTSTFSSRSDVTPFSFETPLTPPHDSKEDAAFFFFAFLRAYRHTTSSSPFVVVLSSS